MAEEAVQSGDTGATSASPATEAGQGASGSVQDTGTGSSGQGAVDSPKGQEQAAPAEKGKGKAEGEQKPQWDAETARWMQSKGWDQAAYDPSNETHTKMIAAHRNIEREFTQRQQSERTKEIMERAKIVQPEKKTEKEELSPSQAIERDYDAVKNYTLKVLGLQSVADLQLKHPDVAAQLQSEFDTAWRKAIKEDLRWEKDREAAKTRADEEKANFQRDFDAARKLSDSHIAQVRQKNPQFDAHMKNSGMEKLLQTLEEKHSLWRELLFIDPEVVNFFSTAAEAIEYRKSEPERVKQWQQDYEKKKLELAKASGPRPAGTGTAPHPAFINGGTWDKTLDAVSTKAK